jgi:TolB-like protein/DNA-binding winged helix-turn-helix (wHTH) protein/Tfp pilus assembly protein PilF
MPRPVSGTHQLHLKRYELRRTDGVIVKLERQPMELLIFLAQRHCELVTRDEIAARLWSGGVFVDMERGINNAIHKIRVALHDSPDEPTQLQTVVGKGYRFIGRLEMLGAATGLHTNTAPVVSDAPTVPVGLRALSLGRRALISAGITIAAIFLVGCLAVWRSRASASHAAIRSLVVLPLENLSGDPAQDYFADGVTDELTTELAQVPALRVISRISAMQYRARRKGTPEIAAELHVDALVEGSVARSGDHVRITAQLIEAKGDRHLWAQSFEGQLKDLVALQDDAARRIAEQIRLHLSPREQRQSIQARAINPEAHDLYMHGVALRDNNDEISLGKSIEWFHRSLQKDPDYAPAHAGLAVAYTFQSYLGVLPAQETFPKAEEAARRAIALDPSLGKAHDALGWVAYVYRWDWPLAERELRRALELNPNDVDAHHYYSHYLFTMGRQTEALAEGETAAGLDPLSQIQRNHLLWQYVEARDPGRAMKIGNEILRAGLTDPSQYVLISTSYVDKGQFDQAIALLQKAISLSPNRTESRAALASAYAQRGNASEARKILRKLEQPPLTQYVSPMSIAAVYCALGDKDRALEWLEKAIDQHDASVSDLPSLPFVDPLRDDPRFQNLLGRIGLPSRN